MIVNPNIAIPKGRKSGNHSFYKPNLYYPFCPPNPPSILYIEYRSGIIPTESLLQRISGDVTNRERDHKGDCRNKSFLSQIKI